MASYSAFFSSGLSAHSSLPIVSGDAHMDDVCGDARSSTPSSAASSNLNVPMGQDTTNTLHRPTLRKRRSSLTLGTTPMAAIKSPVRNAGAALQRHMSSMSIPTTSSTGGTRSRSGSNAAAKGPVANMATDSKSRSRSGSVGTALRPRGKSIRRAALPPPSAPLPPLPPLPIPTSAPPTNTAFDVSMISSQIPTVSTPDRVTRSRGYSVENGYRICEESP